MCGEFDGWDVDISANQQLFQGISVFAELNNLTNRVIRDEIRHPRADDINPPTGSQETWPDRSTYVGWRATLGLRYRLQ